MQLKLDVPAVDVIRREPAPDPQLIARWLATLPYDAPAESAAQILQRLERINRQKLTAALRLRLAEIFRPEIHKLTAILQADTLPGQASLEQFATLARSLLTELGYSYKLATRALARWQFAFHTPAALPMALAQTLTCQTRLAHACYRAHIPLPPGFWLEFYALYQYAGHYHCQDTHFPGAGLAACSLSARQALLLAALDPYHLEAGERREAQRLVTQAAPQTRLAPWIDDTDSPCPLWVNMALDRAPRPGLPPPEKTHRWLLDAAPLQALLVQSMRRLQNGEPPALLGLSDVPGATAQIDLLERLHTSLEGRQRQFRRHTLNGLTVNVVSGLHGIHQLFTMATPPDDTPWLAINDSASGIALSGPAKNVTRLRVGELLAMRTQITPGWSLALVRWLRVNANDTVTLGLERLSPTARAITLSPSGLGLGLPPHQGLLLPANDQLHQEERLLLGRGQALEGKLAYLENAGETTPVRMGTLLEQTSSVRLFTCQRLLNSPPRPTP